MTFSIFREVRVYNKFDKYNVLPRRRRSELDFRSKISGVRIEIECASDFAGRLLLRSENHDEDIVKTVINSHAQGNAFIKYSRVLENIIRMGVGITMFRRALWRTQEKNAGRFLKN